MLIKLQCKKPDLKFRADNNSVLTGYCFLFNEVAHGAAEGPECMSPNMNIRISDDCLLLRAHDSSKILGKVHNNLFFEDDDKGLRFKITSFPGTELGRETETLIRQKLLDGVSIGFVENQSSQSGGITVQSDITIREMSIVSRPAYPSARIEERAKLIFEKPKRKKMFNDNPLPPEILC